MEKATYPGRSGDGPDSATGFRRLMEEAGAVGFAAGNSGVRMAKDARKSTETEAEIRFYDAFFQAFQGR